MSHRPFLIIKTELGFGTGGKHAQIAIKCSELISLSSDPQGMWFHSTKQRERVYAERRASEYVEGLTGRIS